MKTETLKLLNDTVAKFGNLAKLIEQETHEVHASGDHIAIIVHYDQIRIAMDVVKKGRETLDLIKDRLSAEIVPEVMAENRIKTINIEGVGRVTVSARFSASIIDDPERGKEPGHEWLLANNGKDLVKPTVNSSALSAFAKERINDQGRDMPEDLFKVGTKPYTSITKGK